MQYIFEMPYSPTVSQSFFNQEIKTASVPPNILNQDPYFYVPNNFFIACFISLFLRLYITGLMSGVTTE